MKGFIAWIIVSLCLTVQVLKAQQEEEVVKPENGTYLLWSMGDLVKSRDPRLEEIHRHEWIYELIGGFIMNTRPVDNLRMTINFEIGTYNVYPRNPGGYDGEGTQDTKFDTYIEEAKGVFNFGENMPTAVEFEFGYFLNRYNHTARVFGEYLFRSMIYPSILFNGFDYPWYPLSGARIGNKLSDNFHHNLYLLTEFDHYPYFDFSLAYEFSLNLGDILEVGAGANAKRILPVRPSLTTPGNPENTYARIPRQTAYITDSTGAVVDTLIIDAPQEGFLDGKNRFPEVDRAYKNNITKNLLPGINAERSHYSFQGLVLMGRLALFPLAVMDFKGLSLYSEMGLLGWNNYPVLYENRNERVPVMGGIQLNLPGIIDVLAFEVEYFNSKAVPSYYWRGINNLPHPGDYNAPGITDTLALAAEAERLEKDNLKWMIYARKAFKGFSLALQVGTDHMRRDIEDYGGVRYPEILTEPSHWYWQLRVRLPI